MCGAEGRQDRNGGQRRAKGKSQVVAQPALSQVSRSFLVRFSFSAAALTSPDWLTEKQHSSSRERQREAQTFVSRH